MKKLADISSFERLSGSFCAGTVSDVAVFNKLWLYDDEVPVYAHMLPYIINGEHDEYSDPEQAEEDERSYNEWRARILAETGGTMITICPMGDEDGEFDKDFCVPAYGGLRGDCVLCSVFVDVPGDEKPDWA